MKKIKLFPFQKKVLEETEGRNRVAYYLDMGLGKTFVGRKARLQTGLITLRRITNVIAST